MKENNKNSIFQNPKGTHDILPDEIYKWHYVESIAKEVSLAFHAREIRTPIFEHTELFLRGVGDGTDIVSKEMYTFLDKGGRSLTLKPEGTAAIARSYVQHNLESLGLPLRLYYITPVFRYENPQKGRFRQHHQFGIECFGSSSALMDFEVILLAYVFLNKLGISNFSLYINSIGCSACRSIYVQALKSFIQANSCAFCSTCMERLNTNPLRILDCKVKSCKEALVNSPLIIDFLCIDCKQHQEHLTNQLAYANIEYSINPHIVRGLDYYNRTVFEFVTNSQILANQSTICGGGRYDNLIDTVGGKPTQCVGFGLGLERLIALMTEQKVGFGFDSKPDLSVIYVDVKQLDFAMQLACKLRMDGVIVDIDYTCKSLKSQFKRADRQRTKYALVIGADEIAKGSAILRDMSTKKESEVELDNINSVIELLCKKK